MALLSDVSVAQYQRMLDGYDFCPIECPLHGARFDVRTGAALTSPAETALATYPVRVAGDAVEIDVTSAPSNPDAST
jgi:3-phenylpropionate/trans-cinnamate dioxygenase ferredoxin subunit